MKETDKIFIDLNKLSIDKRVELINLTTKRDIDDFCVKDKHKESMILVNHSSHPWDHNGWYLWFGVGNPDSETHKEIDYEEFIKRFAY